MQVLLSVEMFGLCLTLRILYYIFVFNECQIREWNTKNKTGFGTVYLKLIPLGFNNLPKIGWALT